MGDLSAHFSRSEFWDHNNGELVIDLLLIAALERLREDVGRPLRIISGYRTKATNDQVGGAPNSQHLLGRAADIPVLYATVDQALAAGFRGIGRDGEWAVHVDVRNTPGVGQAVIFDD